MEFWSVFGPVGTAVVTPALAGVFAYFAARRGLKDELELRDQHDWRPHRMELFLDVADVVGRDMALVRSAALEKRLIENGIDTSSGLAATWRAARRRDKLAQSRFMRLELACSQNSRAAVRGLATAMTDLERAVEEYEGKREVELLTPKEHPAELIASLEKITCCDTALGQHYAWWLWHAWPEIGLDPGEEPSPPPPSRAERQEAAATRDEQQEAADHARTFEQLTAEYRADPAKLDRALADNPRKRPDRGGSGAT